MTAYAAVLAAAFGTAFAVGSAAGPVGARSVEDPHSTGSEHPGDGGTAVAALPGLASSDAGYTLDPGERELPAGPAAPLEFTIEDADGRPVTTYETEHEKEMHLIVVRRDLSGFQHVHPSRAADGTWSVVLDLPAAGSYRAFADFAPEGFDDSITLGTDLVVAEDFVPVALPITEAQGGETGGPEIRFGAEFPTSGTYRLFLDFQVGGTVRTAEFTVEIP